MAIEQYSSSEFSSGGIVHEVHRRGQGPAVLIMHEMPGLTDEVVRFANWVVDAGFTVFLPCLFGTAGDEFDATKNYKAMAGACIRREFSVLAKRRSSPVTSWLRALSRSIHEEIGGPGIGAIGMCMTGNFALSLMVDEHVMAPVLCQPSLPFSVSKYHRKALHLSDDDLLAIKKRTQAGLPVLGLRFSEDFMCPKERFATLRRELGGAFEGIEIDSRPGNTHGLSKRAHSVLTHDLVDEVGHVTIAARDRVLEFFRQNLVIPA